MATEKEYIIHLFSKYLRNEITEEELEQLFKAIGDREEKDFLKDEEIMEILGKEGTEEADVDWEKMFSGIVEEDLDEEERESPSDFLPGRSAFYYVKIAAVAALFLLLSVGGIYFFKNNKGIENIPAVATLSEKPADVLPGGNKATLTLSSGQAVVLDEMSDGQVTEEGEDGIVKKEDGELLYATGGEKKKKAIAYNTLTTPKGGQYRLTLSDGTKVWLNAASSIRFPVTFPEDERTVEISGEVYFEVEHDENRPFLVHAGSSVIEDLGTAFNVKAYEEENGVTTTLLEGEVKVGEVFLKPGEQAVQEPGKKTKVLTDINTGDEIAWKEGFFAFRNASLPSIMRSLSRWYDLEVVYENEEVEGQRFSGKIDRSLTLRQVLDGLRLTAANFEIKSDRKVIVKPLKEG